MSRFSMVAWGVILLLFILVGTFFFKLRPQYAGNLNGAPVKDTTEVLFDTFGVPHIYAQNEEDAYSTLGYLHAQERLFQMELLRRVGSGRLSEIFGAETIEIDILFRKLGVSHKAKQTASRLAETPNSPWSKACKAYLNGVNNFIDNGATPLEFRALSITKQHFTIEDMHVIAGFMAFNFTSAMKVDPLTTYMRDVLGPEYLSDLHLDYEPGSLTIPAFPKKYTQDSLVAISSISKILGDLALPVFYGSNSWVIGGKNTENGKVLLANDTHISYAQPCTWFEAHIEYPGYSFYGNHMAGIPFGLVGHSKDVAWGMTMFLNDDLDLYCEKISPDGLSYEFNGRYRAMAIRDEIIQVKDSSDVTIQVKNTHHGPLVTSSLNNIGGNDEVSCQWNYIDLPNDLLEAFYRLNHAEVMSDAREAVKKIAAPGLNVSYGDREGNIAIWACAKLAIRPDHVNPKFILNGYTGADDIIGYMDFDENPHVENPPWGYVYSANNMHQPKAGKPYPGYYEPDNRASRIAQKLDARTDWTVEAMKKLVNDHYSKDDRDLSKDLINILSTNELDSLSEMERSALRQVKEWDGEHGVDEVGPAIYNRWLYHIMKSAMIDELGDERFKELLSTNFIKSSIKELVCNDKSVWWDDVRTEDDIEERDVLIGKAYVGAVAEMEKFYGANMEEWKWGAYHKTLFPHSFNKKAIVRELVNVGPFPSPGATETVNNAYFPLSDEPEVFSMHGPQMRILLDFSDIENSLSILPTGQSGVVMSKHYSDQTEMYLRGAFRPQHMNRRKIEKESTRLLLIPSK